MKKMGMIILIFAFTRTLLAPVYNWLPIMESKGINYYEPLIKVIVLCESSNDPLAYNEAEQATGAFQIRPVRIEDYNKQTGSNYTINDCFDYDISRKVFMHYTRGRDYETIARCWAGGEACTKKATNRYWNKIKVLL